MGICESKLADGSICDKTTVWNDMCEDCNNRYEDECREFIDSGIPYATYTFDHFSVRQNQGTAEIVNPKGQVFCNVFMGENCFELAKKRALLICNVLNKAKLECKL